MRYAGADSGGMDSGDDEGGHAPAEFDELRDASASAPQRDALPDGSYAVSHLITERHLGTQRQFRVRWIGYSSADDTWENAKDILTPVLIEHFERLRDSCAGDVRTALRLQLNSLGARREQHEQFLGVDGTAWLHKPGHHASSESAEDDSKVETAMRWWLSAQWSDEGTQQPAQKCPKRTDWSQKHELEQHEQLPPHELLVQRLEQHMAANGVSKRGVKLATRCRPSLSVWLGRKPVGQDGLRQSAANEAEMDWRIAAYLRKEETAAAAAACTPSTPAQLTAALPHPAAESRRVLLHEDSSKDFWVACDRCHKWRNLYLRGSSRQVGDTWYCEQNPDPLHDDCSYAQEEDEEDDQADAALLSGPERASNHAAGGSSSAFPPGAAAAPQQQVISSTSSSSTSNAAGKRPRESDSEPPPGCTPPPVRASQYAEGHRLQSADGSTWIVEVGQFGANISDSSLQSRWALVESAVQRPVSEARLQGLGKWTPCRHCGKPCSVNGNGLEKHEAICARRPNPDVSAASAAQHAQLVQRLEEHMAVHGLTQRQVASAAGISCQGKLSMWLGRNMAASMPSATMVEMDAQIAAYLDGTPNPPAPTSATTAPHVSSAEHTQLVQRLEVHRAAQDLSLVQMAKAARLSSGGLLSMWLGRSRVRLFAASEADTDARVAAYLDGWEMPQGQAALPLAPPKQRARQKNQWTHVKRWKQRTPVLTSVSGGDHHTVSQSGGCSPEEEEGEYSEYTAELLPIAADWPPARFPPAAPPVCACGSACVWLRRRWFCAHDEGGCHFESEAHPEPAPLTPLCHCSDARPCKWLLGRWWCVGHPHGGCGFEHTPTSPAEPTLVAAAHGGASRAVGSIGAEMEMARGCAAMLTASAFGLWSTLTLTLSLTLTLTLTLTMALTL